MVEVDLKSRIIKVLASKNLEELIDFEAIAFELIDQIDEWLIDTLEIGKGGC